MGCGTYGIRPEHLAITETGRWQGRVRHVERLGADTVIYLDVPEWGEMIVRAEGGTNPKVGSMLAVDPVPGKEIRFP